MNIYLKNTLKYIYIRPTLGAFNKYLIWARIKGPNEYSFKKTH